MIQRALARFLFAHDRRTGLVGPRSEPRSTAGTPRPASGSPSPGGATLDRHIEPARGQPRHDLPNARLRERVTVTLQRADPVGARVGTASRQPPHAPHLTCANALASVS